MTIIAILIAFALCYFIRELGQLHRFDWLKPYIDGCNERLNRIPGWQGLIGFIVILALPLLLLAVAHNLIYSLLGTLGAFILAIAVLIYTFGPHDLDTNIDAIIHAQDDEAQAKDLSELLGAKLRNDESGQGQVVDAVFRESLQRWFGTIFWFAVLGIFGALLYRLSDRINEGDLSLPDDQALLFVRLRQVLDWPVAQLMTLSLAIATDFDSVSKAWREYHNEQGHGLFEGDNGFLYASARQIVLSGHAANDGYADQLTGPLACLKQSMDLVWRSLGVWLTVLALLLLVGVIA